MKTIEGYAEMGKNHDIMEALVLLTKAYISQCGISLGFRTVVYDAAEPWLERLAWINLPLSEMARKEPLVCVMPYITSEYDPEIYDEYDITGMDKEELLDCCKQIIQEGTFDEATLEVLCWGILKGKEETMTLSQKIVVTAPDGTILNGVLSEQRCSGTYMTMTSPFNDVGILKCELVRDARELLLEGYKDYQRLYKMEDEIRALYPQYIDELQKRDKDSSWAKHCAFRSVYGKITNGKVLVAPEKLFREWFGLVIYK